jgi:ribosomal protein S27AE
MKINRLSYCAADCKYWPAQDGPECPNCPPKIEAIKEYQKHQHARRIVREAIKSGQLKKPEKCQHCGEIKPLEANHKGYNHPLEVRWLCRKCHQLTYIGYGGSDIWIFEK